MQGDEQKEPQQQAHAQPAMLDYGISDPIPSRWPSSLSLAIILSSIHLYISAIAMCSGGPSSPRLFWRIWFAPDFVVRWILRPVYPRGNDAIYMVVWELLGGSLLFGFTFAFLIHYLKRRRMRRM